MIKIVYIILLYMNLLSPMNADSGAWLQAGMIHTKFVITNDEFISAMCRPNTFEDSIIPKLTPVFYRSVKSIDHFGDYGAARMEIDGMPNEEGDVHIAVTRALWSVAFHV